MKTYFMVVLIDLWPKFFCNKGWGAIRQQRHENAKRLGIIPPDVPLGDMLPIFKEWDALSEEVQKIKVKAMAVDTGMLEVMDFYIGRYIQNLESKESLENIIFIITSDNGPEASATGSVALMSLWRKYIGRIRTMKLWVKKVLIIL